MSSTANRGAVVAASLIRNVSPADVTASVDLFASDPETAIRLRDAVVAAVAASPGGLDVGDVAGLAVVSVARHYARTGDAVHAVRSAVRFARQAVVAAGAASVTVSIDSDDETGEAIRSRLAAWVGGQDPAVLVCGTDSLSSRVGEAVDGLPVDVREAWRAISGAYLAHLTGCDRCEAVDGARPNRVTLATVRPHVTGEVPKSGPWQAMARRDRRTVEAVAAVLLPLVESVPMPDQTGPVWDLIRALREVPTSGRGATGAGPVRAGLVWSRTGEARTVTAPRLGAPVDVPGDRVADVAARLAVRHADRVAAHRARMADRAARPAVTDAPSARVHVPAGESVPDAWGRTVPTMGATVTAPAGPVSLPAWTDGPAPVAPGEPASPVTRGRYVTAPGATTVARTVWHATRVDGRTFGGPVPADVDYVTVRTADGETVRRPMSDVEVGAMKREPETVEIAGETVRVVRRDWDGEGADRVTTSPAGPGARSVAAVERDGARWGDAPVRSGKVPVSPRKRGGGQTGPTVPAGAHRAL